MRLAGEQGGDFRGGFASEELEIGGRKLLLEPSSRGLFEIPEGTRLAPGAFDKDAVALMTKLGAKAAASGTKTNFYGFGMATYDLLPPPSGLEKELGEKRVVNYTGCGIALGEPLDLSPEAVQAKVGAKEPLEKAELAEATAKVVYEEVCALYSTIEECTGTGSEFPLPPGAARPWQTESA